MHSVDFWSLVRNLGVGLVLPPGINVVLILLAFALLVWPARRALRRLGAACLLLSAALLYGFSAPIAANWLIDQVQSRAPAALTSAHIAAMASNKPDAVVLLTGGVATHAPEYEGIPRPSDASWVRLAYAENLALRLELPLLISGAGPIDGLNEAETIARFAWRTPAARILLERVSINTRESAKEIRKAYPSIRRIVLVSDAVHLLRAVPLFAQAGFDVVPAPTRFADVRLRTPGSFVPSPHKLVETRAALHAALGYLTGQ